MDKYHSGNEDGAHQITERVNRHEKITLYIPPCECHICSSACSAAGS
jgi:hypothetical protein